MAKRRKHTISSPEQIKARTKNYDIFRLRGMIASIRNIQQNGKDYLTAQDSVTRDLIDECAIVTTVKRMITRRKT